MALPPGVTAKTVSLGIASFADGTLVAGRVTVSMPVNVVHLPSNRPVFSSDITKPFVDGAVSFDLCPTDADGLNRTDWTYRLKVEVQGAAVQPPALYFTLPTASPDIVDLDGLATAPASDGTPVGLPGALVLPEGGTNGQALIYADGEVVWGTVSGGTGGGGAVDSVNGKTGVVVLSPADVGAQPAGSYATTTALSDGLATKVNSSTYTAGLAGKVDSTDTRLTDARTPLAHTQAATSITGLATVATSGSYTDLSAKPTIPTTAAQVGADPTGSAAAAQAYAIQRTNHTGTQAASTITGLATVATTGAYADLSGKPTIPAAYTDEQAQDAAAALFSAGTHTGATVTYNDAANSLSLTVSGGGGSGDVPYMQFKPPVGGAITQGNTNTTTAAPPLGELWLSPMLIPAGTYDLVSCRVQTPAAGATVKMAAYTVDATTGQPGTLLWETAAAAATSGGFLGTALTTAWVVASPGIAIWWGLVNQGTALTSYWGTNAGYGLPRIDGNGSTIDLGGTQVPASVKVTGVTGAAPTSNPTVTWNGTSAVAYRLALRRSA